MDDQDKENFPKENIPHPQTVISSRYLQPNKANNHAPRETPLPSTRRSRLVRELLSNKKDLTGSSHMDSNKPPSTIIRSRFNNFMNGAASLNHSNSKRKRLFENLDGNSFNTDSDFQTPLKVKNVDSQNPSFFTTIFDKRNGLVNQTPLLNPIFETPLVRRSLEGTNNGDSHISSNFPKDESGAVFLNNSDNFIIETSKNTNKVSGNELDFDSSTHQTPVRVQLNDSERKIDSIARPGSAIRKMLDDSLKESRRISELEKAKQQSNKASYEIKRLSSELEKSQLESESVISDLKNKIESQDRKIQNLENERDWLFEKEKQSEKSLKLSEKTLQDNKDKYEKIIEKLKVHISEEESIRFEQENLFENDRSNFINKVSNLELRLVKVENYKNLMEKQLCSIIANSDSGYDVALISSQGWQKIIETIQEIMSSKSLKISQLKLSSSDVNTSLSSDDHILNDLKEFSNLDQKSQTIPNTISYILKLKNQIALLEREISSALSQSNALKIENDSLRNSSLSLKFQIDDLNLIKERNNELESKLKRMEASRDELSKLEAEFNLLAQEKNEWNSIFKNDAKSDGSVEEVSPYQAANLVLNLRDELTNLNEIVGLLNAKNMNYESQIDEFQKTISEFKSKVVKLEAELLESSNKVTRAEKSKSSIEREFQSLRAQLSSYEYEESHLMTGNYDKTKSDRIKNLEDLVNDQRSHIFELENLLESENLSKLSLNPEDIEDIKKKIFLSSETKDRLVSTHDSLNKLNYESSISELQLKYNEAQIQLEEKVKEIHSLSLENSKLLLSLEEAEKNISILEYKVGAGDYNPLTTRVLMLADNPSSRDYSIKKEHLLNLKDENSELLKQLKNALDSLSRIQDSNLIHHDEGISKSDSPSTSNPTQDNSTDLKVSENSQSLNIDSGLFKTISNLKADNEALVNKLANSKIAIKRLKEVWRAKALELREAVCSLLGYQMDFLENGRVRLTSIYAESNMNSFLFSSNPHNKGTIELLGGGNKDYLNSVQADIRYWVSEQGSIPAFLATTTLQLYEENPRTNQTPN
ncbi:Spindle assembly checkpoint component MAD1 [Smittium mucronatum]|uniref:Spindle assembly checkpoint component MAD1 n=1 Tax=Smittium mucronatum TaxID=133383 RepID=A0A1R0GS59_9FUNG|nr:Spindle assembly checkpoint component MAD1 [Smittium mucronatum]